jgi:nitroimidazol reductase NimA-like FMN-containing flavoprotein (pyridoxamine 5'-phosphate oxidase superfamily)
VPKLDIAMTDEERDAYLVERKIIRLATADERGTPHVVPLWFVWHEGVLYLNSTLGNVTVDNMDRSGLASGTIDDGDAYDELRGVTITGRVERIGDTAPEVVERTWSEKYLAGNEVPYRKWRNRSWFVLTPERIASWDFRKIPEARERARREREGG